MARKREILARVLDNRLAYSTLNAFYHRSVLLCLNYHRVADRVQHNDAVISCSPAELEWQAAWLKAKACVIDGHQCENLVAGTVPLARKSVCLTFDDGYSDNFQAGRTLMEKYGLPAVFFITTGFIETGIIPKPDRIAYAIKRSPRTSIALPSLEGLPLRTLDLTDRRQATTSLLRQFRNLSPATQDSLVNALEEAAGASAVEADATDPLFMTWQQIRALQEMGHTIGAHTHTHPNLATLSEDEQVQEMRTARDIIRQKTGIEPKLLSYPFGKPNCFNSITRAAARGAGFVAGFSFYGGQNELGRWDAYNIRRMAVESDVSRSLFRARVLSPLAV